MMKSIRINFSKPTWPSWQSYEAPESWLPPTDIYAAPNGWLVKVDLAGVRREDVECFTHGRELYIRGYRPDLTAAHGISQCYLEISYTNFERIIEFPQDIESAEIHYDYHAGMFLIRIERR